MTLEILGMTPNPNLPLSFLGPLCVTAILLVSPSFAKAADHASTFFESRIRPLLVTHCYECHSSATKQKGGLTLDSKGGWEKGGDSGPALVPGKPRDSLLLKAVRWTDKELRMPPEKAGGRLTDAQIADFESWISEGAFDPRLSETAIAAKKSWEELFTARRQWWSLQPLHVTRPPVAMAAEWSASAVDRFVHDRILKAGVVASPRADATSLIRRATLVLTGLPPTTEDVETFALKARKNLPKAYGELVDHLLSRPQFGEHFTRHWLDVVRFTETHGNEWNYDVAYAWRYRDYVIRAFNEDLPYDQFVREQIAGDLLPKPRWNRKERYNESAIGTAFFRFGEVNHDSCVTFAAIGYDIVDNQLDTLTKAFQATTVACARCHDHKMDAVSTKDYHALLGVLRSTRSVQHTLDSPEVNRDALAQLRRLKRQLRSELVDVWRTDAKALTVSNLSGQVGALKGKSPASSDPLHPWFTACHTETQTVAQAWAMLATNHSLERMRVAEFNRTNFSTLADFREQLPSGWTHTGMGLRSGVSSQDDFVVAHEGERAVKGLLPSGLFTYSLSDRLNGALRSPPLRRTHGKVSFEVLGGRFSLARIVFNNCQLNYNHQHSLHHTNWSWVTVDLPEKTDELHPYAELLTYWDNPKFPDPLGTLGKDTENQRGPYSEHAKNPRTWWGIRRIVQHDSSETPREELSHLSRLFEGPVPQSKEAVAARYASAAEKAVEAFTSRSASDDDVRWLDWLVKNGLLSNRKSSSPRLAKLVEHYRSIENQLSLPTVMPGMADEGAPFTQPILLRGDYNKRGARVDPAYVEALTPTGYTLSGKGSGRADVAKLIASPDNPITSRVMVNRVWQWVFGKALVATPDDFGHLGESPSHPDLLDYLSSRFVKEGWSTKQLIRTLVLSRTFQSASAPTPQAQQLDPQNLLLSHHSARRVEAEVIRDSILAVSGRLDPQLYGPSVHPFREKADPEKRLFTGSVDGEGRRSLYLKVQLMEAPHFLSAFNLPGGKVTQGRRDNSNVPAQSLALLNDPFVRGMSDLWASRLLKEGHRNVEDRLTAMFSATLGRSPKPLELERFKAMVRDLASTHGVSESGLMASHAVWKDLAHTLFNLKEFIFIP